MQWPCRTQSTVSQTDLAYMEDTRRIGVEFYDVINRNHTKELKKRNVSVLAR